MNAITEQELHQELKQKINKIDKLEKSIVSDEIVNSLRRDVDNLKSHVDNGKSELYSAIIDKKSTPKSKDFKDLIQGVKVINISTSDNIEQNKQYESKINILTSDKEKLNRQIQQLTDDKSQLLNRISSIKQAKGNAQTTDVLEGKTFTNDNGILLTGSIPNKGNTVLECSENDQKIEKGYYNGISVKGLNSLSQDKISNIIQYVLNNNNNKNTISKNMFKDIIKNIDSSDLKYELSKNSNIKMHNVQSIELKSVTLSSSSSETFNFQLKFCPKTIMIPSLDFMTTSSSISLGYSETTDRGFNRLGGQFISLSINFTSNSMSAILHNSWRRGSQTSRELRILIFDTDLTSV